MKFRAMVVREIKEGQYARSIAERDISDLPEGDILVKVKYSSLNYKDALSAMGNKGITKQYPHTPGIDASGIVAESRTADFKEGDEVIITGYDFGMNTSGGFAEYIRVPAAWVLKKPDNLTLKESMIFGTAGFTAALSVYKLIEYGEVKPENGKILVTGARGGVGSHAVSFLAKAGYPVTAVTGIHADPEKEFPEDEVFLKSIGAKEVIPREEVNDETGKPLLKSLWAGVIDTIGGNILSSVIRQTAYAGAVTTCGNAAGMNFEANVFPFILRGVTLFGIDSVECPMGPRKETWIRMANEWKPDNLEQHASECSLEEVDTFIEIMLRGHIKERKVINLEL
jgi:putative YhdH/YhfP family quinone oxidoreductase